MISGRGLGHTGGTLDKMDAIPGYVSQPDLETFRRVVREVGCAIIGQTADLAPADRRLYAIRDVTGTVESLDLITASILSKKLAAGLDGLVMDVKVGTGAFMRDIDGGRALAESARRGGATARASPTTALLTDMNEPLASAAGNAVEVAYALDYLTGAPARAALPRRDGGARGRDAAARAPRRDARGGRAPGSRKRCRPAAPPRPSTAWSRRSAGRATSSSDPTRHLAAAPIVAAVHAERAGFVQAIATRELGLAVVALGGGRTRPEDAIDHAVGLTELAGSRRARRRRAAARHRPCPRCRGDLDIAAAMLRRAYRAGRGTRLAEAGHRRAHRMSLLVAITQWEPEPWIERFRRLMPERAVVALGEPFDRRRSPVRRLLEAPARAASPALPNLAGAVLARRRGRPSHGRPAAAGRAGGARRRRRPDEPHERVRRAALPDASAPPARAMTRSSGRSCGSTTASSPAAHDVRVGIMGLGVLGQDAARKLAVMGFDVAGWSRSPRSIEGIDDLFGRGGARPLPRPHRHPRLPVAADAGHARHPEPLGLRAPRPRRASRRAGGHQRRPRRAPGRGRHPRLPRRRHPQGRDPRRVRDRAAAARVAAMDPPRRHHHAAQRGDERPGVDRGPDRRADPQPRARRAAAQRRRSARRGIEDS